ncbi:SAV_915 family protein [Streptomyces sp. NPDC002564]|uniref:SAV_915 family protein n=2 Tax=unclassified Streptomyces TaxID=2593676 RepID=UPI0036D003A9
MAELPCGEDPEPCEPGPAGPLFVPVRPGPAGCVARLFRTPVGGRTAVAFTTPQRLTAALGARQEWIRLSEPALRALTVPLGVGEVTVDPRFAAQPVGAPPLRPAARYAAGLRDRGPRTVDALALRATGAAALVGALTPWIG